MSASVLDRLKGLDGGDVGGKRVLVRADLNVPTANGEVADATRIARFLPTVEDLAARGARVVILSHFGRPKGECKPSMTLAPVGRKMAALLEDKGIRVSFAGDCIGPVAMAAVGGLKNGEAVLLENLRFHAGEENNDARFAQALAELGDIYVDDAFSCAHRAHASTEALAHLLPAYAGPSLMAELKALDRALGDPERPVAAVVGGAKVSSKIPVLTNLVNKCDILIIGGGMANTFLHAQGIAVGKSLCEPDFAEMVHEIMASAEASGCRIALPVDAVVASEFAEGAVMGTFDVQNVPQEGMILDVGPKTLEALQADIAGCRTLLWNGPLGAFEIAPFGEGTFALARKAAALAREGRLVTVAGGGDTVAALNAAGVTGDFTYVSTAGGAFLEWLEGRDLPGVMALAGPA